MQMNLASFFEVEQTVAWVEANKFKRVALQLPDSLLHLGFELSQLLSRETAQHEFKTFVCADSNYGDCCVDQTTAMHNDADCVVHYGLSCLSRPTKLPAFLVFCDLEASAKFAQTKDLSERVDSMLEQELKGLTKIYVEFDVRYDRFARGSFERFTCSRAPPRELIPSSQVKEEEDGNSNAVDYSQYEAVIFVGPSESSAQLDRIAMAACTTSQVFSFDLVQLTNIQANRSLGRRFVLVERVKDAQIIGILVGTMSVTGYARVIQELKLAIENSGRKSYLFVFGKLSTAKLANFPHVDAFVLVACPFHSLVSKSFEFNKPIITPYELQVALSNRAWGKYVWDFDQILAPFARDGDEDGEEDGEEVRFSLHAQQIVAKERKSKQEGGTLSLRYESPAAQSLQRAAFQGLDPMDAKHKAPAKAVPGQVGVAARVFDMDDTGKHNPH